MIKLNIPYLYNGQRIYMIVGTGNKKNPYKVIVFYRRPHGSNPEVINNYDFISIVMARKFVEIATCSSSPKIYESEIHTPNQLKKLFGI